MRETIIAGARAAANLAIGATTIVVVWGAAVSFTALGLAVDLWSAAIGGRSAR